MQNKVVAESRCEILAIWAALKPLSENKNDALCVVLLRLLKTKKFDMVLSFCQHCHLNHRTELNKVFQVGCCNFAQMKASAELCNNKLSDAAAKSELETTCYLRKV